MRLVTVRIALQGSCPIHHCQSRRSRRRSPTRSVEDSCCASMARYITRVRVHFRPSLFQFPLLFLSFGLPVLSRGVHSILNSPLRFDNSSPLFWTCGINTIVRLCHGCQYSHMDVSLEQIYTTQNKHIMIRTS